MDINKMRTIEKADNTPENIAEIEKSIKGDTDLEMCILWVLDDGKDNTNAYRVARDAHKELAALRAERDVLKAGDKELDKLVRYLVNSGWVKVDDMPNSEAPQAAMDVMEKLGKRLRELQTEVSELRESERE